MEMKNLQRIFDYGILVRGRDYFNQNRVTVTRWDEHEISGFVRGLRNYSVEMSERNGRYITRCSCPYAAKGYNCKHMAAMAYKWEELQQEEINNQIKMFSDVDFSQSEINLYQLMESQSVRRNDYEEALKMAQNGNVILKNVETRYYTSGENKQVLVVNGTTKSHPDMKTISICVSRDRIEEAECSYCHNHFYGSSYYYSYYRPTLCVHQLALLILFKDYILKYNPGDSTNLYGVRLLRNYGKIRTDTQMEKTIETVKDISLTPRIILSGGRFELSFKIGSGKMYIIKNIDEMIRKRRDKDLLPLGKDNTLNFAIQDFRPQDMKYLDFMVERSSEVATWNEKMSRYATYNTPEVSLKGSIDLNGAPLDQFYDIAKGELIDFDDRDTYGHKKKISIGDSPCKIKLSVDPFYDEDSRLFKGLRISVDMPQIIHGGKYNYFVNNGFISRLSDEDYRSLQTFVENEESYEQVSIDIGKKNLAEFYYRVLPMLMENPLFEIEDNSQAALEYLPLEATFDFYLDVTSDYLLCLADVNYEDKRFPLKQLTDKDYPLTFARDVAQEETVLQTVKDIFPISFEDDNTYALEKDENTIYDLLNIRINELMVYGNVHVSDAFNRLRIKKNFTVNIGISIESDLLNLNISSNDISNEELLDILNSYKLKRKFHRLKSGEFISLEDNDSLEMLAQAFEETGMDIKEFVKGKVHLPLYRSLYLNKMMEDHENLSFERDKQFRNIVKNFNTIRESDYEVPENFKGVLRNYQEYGYKWLHLLSDYHFGGILADDMGLGKTIQFISLVQAVKDEGNLDKPVLIVCPTSVVYNWQEEFQRFAKGIKAVAVVGRISERKQIIERNDVDVFITSYDLLKRDITNYHDKQFSYEVIDEAQNIKNAKTGMAKAVKVIKSDHRFALTGTPIENRLSELWSIMDFCMPGFLYTYDEFRNRYEKSIVKDSDDAATVHLRNMVRPFILRRLKEDVLKDLPDKLEEVRYVRFDDDQQKVYDAQIVKLKNLVETVDSNNQQTRIKVLAELTKARQLCCDPHLLFEDYNGESAKLAATIDLIESAIEGDHRVLVFSQFTSMLEIIEEALKEHHINYFKLTGSTSKEERSRLVHRFNDYEEVPVFLISLKAGGTGLNLTGADVVIHYDPWWNLSAQNQATDRAHRIGQTRDVSVYKLIAKDTIEEKILNLQEAKQELSDAILSGDNKSLTQLSKEELLELLS